MILLVMVSNARSRGCVGVIIQDNGAQCVIQQLVVMWGDEEDVPIRA